MAIASLVLGIVSIPLTIIFIPGILAVVFGFVGRNQIAKAHDTQSGRGMTIAGIVLGSVSVALAVIYIIVVVVAVHSCDPRYQNC